MGYVVHNFILFTLRFAGAKGWNTCTRRDDHASLVYSKKKVSILKSKKKKKETATYVKYIEVIPLGTKPGIIVI